MACEICGRGSCTRSFHSLEQQQLYDDLRERFGGHKTLNEYLDMEEQEEVEDGR